MKGSEVRCACHDFVGQQRFKFMISLLEALGHFDDNKATIAIGNMLDIMIL